MSNKTDPEVPDLRTLIAEKATRPTATCRLPLDQAARAEHAALAEELAEMMTQQASGEVKPRRAGAASPMKAKAQEMRVIQERMEASTLVFTFEALTYDERDQIRQDMRGRDDADEVNLRAIAAMCKQVTGVNGEPYPGSLTWEDFRDLRDKVGVLVFDQTIEAASTEAAGGDFSVPFSSAASRILATAK